MKKMQEEKIQNLLEAGHQELCPVEEHFPLAVKLEAKDGRGRGETRR